MEIDHVHFYVEDAHQTSRWLREKMGFHLIAQGNHQDTSMAIVANNRVFVVVSSPLNASSPVAVYLQSHPPGVVDLAFRVENIDAIITRALNYGGEILEYPQIQGNLKWAKIPGWGSLNHTLIEDSQFKSFPFILPTRKNLNLRQNHEIVTIDHAVLNVPKGHLKAAFAWYQNIFNFQKQQSFSIKTHRSGLYSEALIDPSGQVQFNINEPTSDNSQIQEFIEANGGSGIQHIAFQSTDILETVTKMRAAGVSFLSIPDSYYLNRQSVANGRLKGLLSQEEWQTLRKNQILFDWQEMSPKSLLLQTFTQPIFPQPTFFFEVIERRNQAQGFGEGNFQALFAAVEREQIKRK